MRRRRTSETIQCANWTHMAAGIQLQHRIAPFPQLTNSRRQTTAVAVWSAVCTVRTAWIIVSTSERACCLECCPSNDPRACSENRAFGCTVCIRRQACRYTTASNTDPIIPCRMVWPSRAHHTCMMRRIYDSYQLYSSLPHAARVWGAGFCTCFALLVLVVVAWHGRIILID